MREIQPDGQWRAPRRPPVPLGDYRDDLDAPIIFDGEDPMIVSICMAGLSGVILGAAAALTVQYLTVLTGF